MFEIGKEYNRKSEIHGLYKGQEQGGISTPKDSSVIFVFTSDAGVRHGYQDEFRDNGLFWYTGEGQVGDMKMVAGNKAIIEHAKNNKTIHVFEYTRKAYVRYLGSAECLGYHEEVRPDRNDNDRNVFVFHLYINSIPTEKAVSESKSSYSSYETTSLSNKNIHQLREAALSQPGENSSVQEKRQSAFYRSIALKRYVAARAKGVCEGCNSSAPFHTNTGPFLECHHVHRLSDGGPDHPKNVVALCPNCHRRAHYAKDAASFNTQLKAVAIDAENN